MREGMAYVIIVRFPLLHSEVRNNVIPQPMFVTIASKDTSRSLHSHNILWKILVLQALKVWSLYHRLRSVGLLLLALLVCGGIGFFLARTLPTPVSVLFVVRLT